MKKVFILVSLLLALFLPSLALAARPEVSADNTQFNPLTGIYQLDGNVTVRLPGQIIIADHATVHMYQLTVQASGNVRLSDNDISFYCDQVNVIGNESTAYCSGNCRFTEGATNINSNQGSFNWDSKIATFNGNVMVNGAARQGTVAYNVINKQFQ